MPNPNNTLNLRQPDSESRESTEIRLLRDEFHQHQDRFRDHDEQDEDRHVNTLKRLGDLEVGQEGIKAFMRGRANALAVLMAVLALLIPFMTVIVSAAFAPHGSAKP